jgi:hypothetical protein
VRDEVTRFCRNQGYWKNRPSQQLFKVFNYIYTYYIFIYYDILFIILFIVVARDGSSNNLDKVHATGCRTPK